MNRFNCEQENAGFGEIGKNQSSVITRFNTIKTPMKKLETMATKTPLNKSTRKAFGNVSNTLSASVSKSLASSSVKQKSRANNESRIKDCVKPKSGDECKSKFNDDIETMDCVKEEELSEMNDPITHNLFAIDDSIVYSMGIDEEFIDQLIAQPITSDDIEDIFGHTITDEEIEDIFGYPITDEDIDEICGHSITDDEVTTDDLFLF